jgi:metallophosphoesterase superfamily enzyme
MIAWDDWLLSHARAAIHQPTRTAVVSDLHLGYAEARRRAGESIPAPTVEEVLHPLQSLLRSLDIHSLVIAGDLFEAGPNEAVIASLLTWLTAAEVEKLSIVPGNHDRGLRNVPDVLKPIEGAVLLGSWHIVHGDGELPGGSVVQGHVHPGLRIGRGLPSVPCFLARPEHLVLPAYSPDASGIDIRNDPCWREYRWLAIAGEAIVDVRP